MMLAQKLYEGIDLGEGSVGLITYMRTDSTRVAESALEAVRAYVKRLMAMNICRKGCALQEQEGRSGRP